MGRLPNGDQTVAIDHAEAVHAAWFSPEAALADRVALRLMPPQVHILTDLAARVAGGLAGLEAWADACGATPLTITPRRLAFDDHPATMLLPWDPRYADDGVGEGEAAPPGHPLAVGPSRMVLRAGGWYLVHCPPAHSGREGY